MAVYLSLIKWISPRYKECKLLKEVEEFNLDQDKRILIRLVLKVKLDPNSKQKSYRLWDNRQRKFDDLVTHEDKKGDKYYRFVIFQEFLNDIFEKFGVQLSQDELWRFDSIISTNSMAVENGN